MKPAILLATFVVVAHLPAVFIAGFAYDDGPAILEHPDLRSFANVPRLFRTEYWGADRANQMYRPLQQVSYLVDGAIFGFAPRATHAVQLAWHVAAVLAGYALLRRVGLSLGPAFAASAAFAVHPAMTDASVWISGRCDVQSLLFSAASLAVLSRPGVISSRSSAFAAGLFLCGAFSKEVALAVPGAAWFLFGRRALQAWPWFLAALVVYGIFRGGAVPGFLPGIPNENGVVLQDRGFFERAGIGARAQLLLVGRLFAPWLTVADHRAHQAALPDTPVGLDGVASCAVFVAVAVAGAFCRGAGRVGLCLRLSAAAACFFVPVLQWWPIGAIMPERFLYVPGFFLLAAFAHAVEPAAIRRPRTAVFLAATVIVGLAFGLAIRSEVYRNDGTYFRDVLSTYPEDERAWNNLGVFLMLDAEPPDFDGADAAFARALAIRPTYRRGRLNAARSILERVRVTHDASGLDGVDDLLRPGVERGDRDALALVGRAELERAERETDPELLIVRLERAESAFRAAGLEREASQATRRLAAETRRSR